MENVEVTYKDTWSAANISIKPGRNGKMDFAEDTGSGVAMAGVETVKSKRDCRCRCRCRCMCA
jgi:hypothetical protein